MATICLAPAGNARSPQGRSGSNGRAQSLEIPLLSPRLGHPVYDAGRKTWRGPGAPATQLSGASARTVQSHEARTDIDVDVVPVVVRHDAARAVVGDQPSDHLGLFARYAEIDRLAGSMLRIVLVPAMTAPGRQVETISKLPKWLRIRPSRLRAADVRHVVEVPAEWPACRWLVLV